MTPYRKRELFKCFEFKTAKEAMVFVLGHWRTRPLPIIEPLLLKANDSYSLAFSYLVHVLDRHRGCFRYQSHYQAWRVLTRRCRKRGQIE